MGPATKDSAAGGAYGVHYKVMGDGSVDVAEAFIELALEKVRTLQYRVFAGVGTSGPSAYRRQRTAAHGYRT